MAACLWQMNPNRTAAEVKEAMEMSGHIYNSPTELLGYGIPDMRVAASLLMSQSVSENRTTSNWLVYPNPVNDYIILQKKGDINTGEINIELYNVDGRIIKKWIEPASSRIVLRDLPATSVAMFFLRINSGDNFETIKLSKNR